MKTTLLSLIFFALAAGNIFAQPSNDNDCNRIQLTVNSSCVYTSGTTTGATQSMPPTNCNATTSPTALDVWYGFQPTSPNQTITVVGSSNFDAVIDLHSFNICANVTSISCADATGAGGTEILNATGLNVGAQYYIRVYNWGTTSGSGTFQICVTGTASSNPDLITQNFNMSPNPVNAGSNLAISFDVKNQGGSTSNACTTNVRINQSSSSVSSSDPLIASLSTPSLAANATTTLNTNYTVPSTYSGTYYVWVILDVNSTAGQGTANEANDKTNYQLIVNSSCVLSGVTPTNISPGIGTPPGSTVSTTTPTLYWNAVSGAVNYGVYIRDMVSNTLVLNNDCATTGTSYTVPAGILSNNGQYRWDIQANDNCSLTCVSNYSSPLYFQVQTCALSASTPTLISPGTGTPPGQIIATTTPTLSWNAVSGAVNYGVYVRDLTTNTLVVNNDCATTGTSYTVPSGMLTNNDQFRWNVKANDNCSLTCVSNYSSDLYFEITGVAVPSINQPEIKFTIYPNPSSGTFTIESSERRYEITITNILGEKILSQKIFSDRTEIDLSNQSSGIYFIRINSEKGSAVKKIIVSK